MCGVCDALGFVWLWFHDIECVACCVRVCVLVGLCLVVVIVGRCYVCVVVSVLVYVVVCGCVCVGCVSHVCVWL